MSGRDRVAIWPVAEMSAQCKYLTSGTITMLGFAQDRRVGNLIDKPGHFNYTVWEPLGVCASCHGTRRCFCLPGSSRRYWRLATPR